MLCLAAINPAEAGSVATIGTITKVITKSTSCDAKNWGSSQLNACACCLTKQKTNTSQTSDKIVSLCMYGKYCTINTLSQLAPEQKTADDIMTTVLWSTVDTPTVTVDPKFINKNGKLTLNGMVPFLTGLKKNIRNFNQTLEADFANPKCLEAKDIGGGGVNTAQLFLVKVDTQCASGQKSSGVLTPKYIIKGTKKGTEEIRNLRLLHQSELKSDYDSLSPTRPKDKIAISFDELNLKYHFKKSDNYLSFLTIAPGKSLMNLSKDLAASIKKGDTADIKKDSDQLYHSFYSLGKGLGELHRRFMNKGDGKKLLGKSIVHGDLHLENVYADPSQNYLITLIDNESFAKSLKEKRPVAVDLFVLYGFTVAQFKSKYKYPTEISLTMWDNLMLRPLLLGYISNWPKSDHAKVMSELKEIFINPTTALKLLPERLVFINVLQYRTKIPDIKRVFNELS